MVKMKKVYQAQLKYGLTEWQPWFEGEDTAASDWTAAISGLEAIAQESAKPNEYYEKAIARIASAGFVHIPK